MHRHGRAASVGVAILDVRTALAHGVEAQLLEQPANLGGFREEFSHRLAWLGGIGNTSL